MLSHLYMAASTVQNAVAPQPEKITPLERKVLKEQVGACNYRLADPQKDSILLKDIADVYASFGMYKQPKVIIYEHKIPNAAHLPNGTILVSMSLLKVLDKRERRMVIAHEAGHHAHHKWFTGLKVLASAGSIIGAALLTSALEKKGKLDLKNQKWNRLIKPLAVSGVFGLLYSGMSFLLGVPLMAVSRMMERNADKQAVQALKDPDALISGLKKIKYRAFHPERQTVPNTDTILREQAPVIPVEEGDPSPPSRSSLREVVEGVYESHPDFSKRFKDIRKSSFRAQSDAEQEVSTADAQHML